MCGRQVVESQQAMSVEHSSVLRRTDYANPKAADALQRRRVRAMDFPSAKVCTCRRSRRHPGGRG